MEINIAGGFITKWQLITYNGLSFIYLINSTANVFIFLSVFLDLLLNYEHADHHFNYYAGLKRESVGFRRSEVGRNGIGERWLNKIWCICSLP